MEELGRARYRKLYGLYLKLEEPEARDARLRQYIQSAVGSAAWNEIDAEAVGSAVAELTRYLEALRDQMTWARQRFQPGPELANVEDMSVRLARVSLAHSKSRYINEWVAIHAPPADRALQALLMARPLRGDSFVLED